MGPAQTELLVLAHVALSTQKLATLREHSIEISDFLHHPQIFDFLNDTFSRTGAMPSPQLLSQFFPNLPFDEIETTSFDGTFERFIAQVSGHRLTSLLSEVATNYSRTGNATEATGQLMAGFPGLTPHISRGLSYTDHQAQDRFDEYIQRQAAFTSTGLVGTRTGLAVFDAQARGWEPGELVGIVARPYVGKSWVLTHSAGTAYREGKRILFLSPEMSRHDVGLRADQLLFPHWEGNDGRLKLPLQELVTGQLPGRTEALYRDWLAHFSQERRWITVDAAADRGIKVATVDSLIVSHAPDLVCIDGLMLLESSYESTWEQAKDISYTLKNVAGNRGVPIICVAQANRITRDTNDIPSLNEVAFGDSISQAFDRMVGIGRPNTGAQTVRLLQCQKFRNGWADFHRRQTISFNPDDGDIGRVVADLTQDEVEIDEPRY